MDLTKREVNEKEAVPMFKSVFTITAPPSLLPTHTQSSTLSSLSRSTSHLPVAPSHDGANISKLRSSYSQQMHNLYKKRSIVEKKRVGKKNYFDTENINK